MSEPSSVTVSLWPATPLPLGVADELQRLGIDVKDPEARGKVLAAHLTRGGQLGLQIELRSRGEFGLSDLEALLAMLRLQRINYAAWDSSGTGRRFEASRDREEAFAVLSDGRAVLTCADLDGLDEEGRADVLLDRLRGMLGRVDPPFSGPVATSRVTIAIYDDELGESGETCSDAPHADLQRRGIAAEDAEAR